MFFEAFKNGGRQLYLVFLQIQIRYGSLKKNGEKVVAFHFYSFLSSTKRHRQDVKEERCPLSILTTQQKKF